MKISYNYDELIQELNEEINDEILSPFDNIQVRRAEKPIAGYKPIVDWYYDDKTMEKDLEVDFSDTQEEKKEKAKISLLYLADKTFLETITVKACLEEMKKWNAVLSAKGKKG